MEIKKIVYNFFLFIVFTAVLYAATILLLIKIKIGKIPLVYRTSEVISWKGGNSYQKFLDFNKNNNWNVIVIGSSHAYRGYDPRIFKKYNVQMFNLGSSGQSLLNSYFIAKNYIVPSTCNLVILDIYDGALASDGLESTSDLTQNISSTKSAIEMAVALKDPRIINMLAVRMFTLNDAPLYLDSAYTLNGFSEKIDSLKNSNKKVVSPKLKVNNEQLNYLKKIFEYFKSKNINVIAVTHPTPKESNNGNHAEFKSFVKSISDYYGVTYLDYSFSHNLNSFHDFYDSHHLNQSGVYKFNEVLIKNLTAKGYLNWH